MNRAVKSHSMRLDGTITYGNILTAVGTIVAVAVSWGVMSTRQEAMDARITKQDAEFSKAISDVREAIKEQRLDTKELQKSVNAITTDTALIRGRLASNDGGSNRSTK